MWTNVKYVLSIKYTLYQQLMKVTFLQDLQQELSISAMPTFLFYKNGEKVADVVGADQGNLQKNLENLISS